MVSGFEEVRRTYVRKQLYEQVWSQPMTRLAKLYGVSDSALRKACGKLNVPMPGLGYWSKVERGKAPERPALPAWDGPEEITCTERRSIRDGAARQTSADSSTEPQVEGKRVLVICVPATLTSPHKLVAETLRTLRREKYGRTNGFDGRDGERLDVRVSSAQLNRALRIMDGLLKGLEARGHKVEVSRKGYVPATVVHIEGTEFHIRLREGHKQLPPGNDAGQEATVNLAGGKAPDLVPSRQLRLGFHSQWPYGFKDVESDGKKRRLEERLAHFVVRLEEEAALIKRQEAERKERERREAEVQARRMEEQRRITGLEQEVAAWEKSQRIRTYIAAVKRTVNRRFGAIPIGSNTDRWLKWARRYADSIDPLMPKPAPPQGTRPAAGGPGS